MPDKYPGKQDDGDVVMLSAAELRKVRAYAAAHGMTVDEAATKLVSDAIAKKFGKNTGMKRAKVYPLPKKH